MRKQISNGFEGDQWVLITYAQNDTAYGVVQEITQIIRITDVTKNIE